MSIILIENIICSLETNKKSQINIVIVQRSRDNFMYVFRNINYQKVIEMLKIQSIRGRKTSLVLYNTNGIYIKFKSNYESLFTIKQLGLVLFSNLF